MEQVLRSPAIQIRNDSGEVIPPFSICRVTTPYGVGADGQTIMNVKKPAADILTPTFVVTHGNELAIGGLGVAVRLKDAVAVAVDLSNPDYAPSIGDRIGPVPKSFKASKGWGNLLVVSDVEPTGVCAVLGVTRDMRVQVKMKEDLLAAVNTDTDPSYAWAYLRRRNDDGDLVVTNQKILICNRFTEISVNAGVYAKAEEMEGEIQLYAADCPRDGDSSESIGFDEEL